MVVGADQFGRIKIAGGCLAILVLALLTPAAVHASCGDYVTVGGRSDHATPNPQDQLPETPPGTPCTGPLCSQAPATAVTPPPAPTSDDSPTSGLLELPQGIGNARVRFQPFAPSSLALQSHSLDIFHPPRTV